jgi:filamentous hemagglutinin
LQQIDGQAVYKAIDDVGAISKGDYFYLDGMHKDHLEVFDSREKFKSVVNMDGTLNNSKTNLGQGRRINVK